MKHCLNIVVFCCIFFLGIPETDCKPIPFSIDAAQFRYDSATTLWEMYYSFPDTALKYAKNTNKYLGELYIRALIFSATDTVAAQQWVVSNERESLTTKTIKNLVGQKMFVLKPGQYTVEIYLYDVNDTTTQAKSNFPIVIRDFSRPSLAMSDIEVATTISSEPGLPAFKKGKLTVVPNASLEYTGNEPEIRLYSEIYNTNLVSPEGFTVNYTIYDALKNEVFSIPITRNSSGEGLAETISLPMTIVPSGVYFVQATVYIPSDSPTDSVSMIKKVYIINPDMPPDMGLVMTEDILFERSEFATMMPEQINSEFEKLSFIASIQDIELYKSLSEDLARQKFLYRFWAQQDPDPTTLGNEALEEFRKNIAYANTFYATIQQKEGWKTDRGRVILKYGKPNEIERRDYNIEGRPYEIWTYNNQQGGIVFAFVDSSGHNNYRLVHSTARGETRNDRWMQRYVQIQNLNPEGGR